MIKRKILADLKKHLSSDQMTIITGPRQVGKTYLMSKLQEYLKDSGENTIWLNIDNEEDKKRFESQADLLSYINLQVGNKKAYVFIDEIQRKENAGLFLKGIYDMNTGHKFIISGSGSLELKAKISESMAGRKQIFNVDPISFEEFINYKTEYKYEDRLTDLFKINIDQVNLLFSEYLVFGGYPRVILASTVEEKQRQMQEIYRSYVDRDIQDLLHLDKTDSFNNLLKILASQIGCLVNINELATTVGVDKKTIKNYLFYLEQTYLVRKITPFFRNVRSEVTKAPIYYFVDLGLRNWLLGLFGLSEIPQSLSGHLFENFIFNTLRSKLEFTPTQIHFWRTKDQAEVDIVLENGFDLTPIEIKYSKLKKQEIPRSLKNFITKYQPKKGYLVHTGNEKSSTSINGTNLESLSFLELITRNL